MGFCIVITFPDISYCQFEGGLVEVPVRRMIVQILSVAVPQSVVSAQIENLRSQTIPTYQAAEGFVSLCLLQRPFVAYVELLMISIWEWEPALNPSPQGNS